MAFVYIAQITDTDDSISAAINTAVTAVETKITALNNEAAQLAQRVTALENRA